MCSGNAGINEQVERSAAVLNGVEQAVIDNKGKVTPTMALNIDRLTLLAARFSNEIS